MKIDYLFAGVGVVGLTLDAKFILGGGRANTVWKKLCPHRHRRAGKSKREQRYEDEPLTNMNRSQRVKMGMCWV